MKSIQTEVASEVASEAAAEVRAEVESIVNGIVSVDGGVTQATALFGHLPQFDSMAAATILAAFEERFGFRIEDDEVGADLFESVATLTAYVAAKLQAHPAA